MTSSSHSRAVEYLATNAIHDADDTGVPRSEFANHGIPDDLIATWRLHRDGLPLLPHGNRSERSGVVLAR